jgi:hypothetical protein
MLDVIEEMEASNWCARLFLKSHSLDQLEAMDNDMSDKDLPKMMQHGRKNITIEQHNKKPGRTRQIIREEECQQLFSIERHKIRSRK